MPNVLSYVWQSVQDSSCKCLLFLRHPICGYHYLLDGEDSKHELACRSGWFSISDSPNVLNVGCIPCPVCSVGAPERQVVIPVRGEVEGIERGGGRTTVLLDDGLGQNTLELDEAFIAFGTAVDDQDLGG